MAARSSWKHPPPDRPLDLVELQAVRAYQAALKALDEAARNVRNAYTPHRKYQREREVDCAKRVEQKALRELQDVLRGDGA